MTALLDELAGAAADLIRRPLPTKVRTHAALLAADTLGVMLAAGRRPESAALVHGDDLTGSWLLAGPRTPHSDADAGTEPEGRNGAGLDAAPGDSLPFTGRDPGSRDIAGLATVPGSVPLARFLTAGYGYGTPDRAAYVNATIACALELDEGMRPTGHPATHVLPAALAAAEVTGASWAELITAFTAGYEVVAGLFDGFRLRPPTHPHGHLGAAGAAVAVALLTGEDPLAMARAAATIPLLTTWAPCLEGANVRNTWAGHAASAGVLARRLVRAGFRGSPSSYDTAFDGLAGDRVEIDPGLFGTRITRGYVKLYSACAITHSAIEAALALHPAGPVEAVRVAVNANSLKTDAPPGETDLSRRFSIPYAVAVALLRGDAGRGRFDTPDPEAVELAGRVTVVEDPDASAAWPDLAPASVTVTGPDGAVRTSRADDAYGHPGNRAPADAVRAKFLSLTECAPATWDLLTSPDAETPVGEVLDALTIPDRG